MWKRLMFILAIGWIAFQTNGQPVANKFGVENDFENDYREEWSAIWITNPDIYLSEFAVIHFRKSFELPEKPESFIVHVSADNRYRLFLNGMEICEGPQRSNLWHWRYTTVDIAPYLKEGENLIAAKVINWGQDRAISQFSHQTGFLLQGNTDKEKVVNTGSPGWKTYHNQAFTPVEVGWRNQKHVRGYYAANPTDSVVGEKYPWGWETLSYDDKGWKNAKYLDRAYTREVRRSLWNLTTRTIPLLYQEVERFAEVERIEGAELPAGFIKGNQPLTIPSRSGVSILIDHSFLTMGYPELIVSKGEGAKINVVYSEALYDDDRQKHHRDKVEGMHIWGIEDFFIPDGGTKRLFRPLWLRAYRYVQLNIETKDEPLVIDDYYHVFSAYPLERKGSFKSSVPEHEKMTDLGWQSIKITTQENLMPDAYYEQSQAAYDGHIHANTIMYTTGDSLSVKDFIRQFDYSRIPDGLTQGYAPDRHHLMIATFSLYWILTIHDYMMQFDDPEFAKEQIPGILSVLRWYEDRMQENGFLGPVKWWAFMDWYTSTGAPNQHPGMNGNSEAKGTEEGNSATYSLLLSHTFQKAAEIIDAVQGEKYFARKYNDWSKKINEGVYNACFDKSRGLLADTPEKILFSQHANIFGVITGCIPKEQQQAVMQKVLSDESLTRCTMPFYSNLWNALYIADMADEIPGQLDLWYGFLEWGLTTTPEQPSISPRSDCHPWSSSPNYALPKFVAGIKSAGPGFKSVKIEPAPGDMEHFETIVPHSKGEIKLKMKRENGKPVFDLQLPKGLGGEFIFEGKTIQLKEGTTKTIKL
jgi:alpha-L-rhamnosidase